MLVLCAFVLTGTAGKVALAQNFPELSGRVVDTAQLLNEAEKSALTEQLKAHEDETSNQIVVATVPALDGYAIADYANRLGRAWQVGTSENDNGILLVVAPNDRKVRIEVGYGLEGALTDALSSIIIQREILPRFRDNDYPGGITQGINAIIKAIEGEYTSPDDTAPGNKGVALPRKFEQFIPLIFIAMVAIPEFLRRLGMHKAANGAFPGGFTGLFATLASGNILFGIVVAVAVFLLLYFKGSRRGGGSSGRHGGYLGTGRRGGFSGGGGGFSGGGGSFGGGGASGSW